MAYPRHDQPIRWRSRPLLAAAGTVVLGILAARALGAGAYWAGAIVALGAAFVGLGVVLWPRRRLVTLRPLVLTALAAVACMGAGAHRYAVWSHQLEAPLGRLAAEVEGYEYPFDVDVRGRVVGHPTATDRRLRFVLAVDSAGIGTMAPARGRTEVTIWHPREAGSDPPVWPDLRSGHYVHLAGDLRALPRRRNPADFDYGAYLQRRGIHAVVSASGAQELTVIDYRPTGAERVVGHVRQHIRGALAAHVPDADARAVMQALLLADRSGIDPAIRRSFSRTGLAHLLAVSGLHVFLVGMVIYGLLKPSLHRLGWPWQRVEIVRAITTLCLIGGYVAVVGGPASAVRALVMAAAFIAGRAFERPSNALNSLGAAALVLLLARPSFLLDVGFQLSFAAVGALILLMPPFEARLPAVAREVALLRYIVRLVLSSIAATLGTMPVLLAHFGIFPPAGVLLNVVAIPSTALALGGGLLCVLFSGWLSPLAAAAGGSAAFFARVVLETGLRGERWLGWAAVDHHVQDLAVLAALALVVLLLAFWDRPRARWRLASASTVCLALAVWLPVLRGDHRPRLEVVFFDVGQGDAALVILPNRRTLLIDAGPRDPFGDAGARTIIPHLDRFRIRRLDAVLITHLHADHLGGLPTLISEIPIDAIYDNGETFDSQLYRESVYLAAHHGIPIHPLRAGDALDLDPSVRLHVLHPGPEPDAHPNDGSLVLRLTFGTVSFLFTGDVEIEAERTLTTRYGALLCASVVKVPHHGSRTSSTEPFVRATTGCGITEHALVSVARRNRYFLPNEDALTRWRAIGLALHLTSDEGALWLRSDGRRVWRWDWR